jgi:ribonuclease HII
MIMGIDEVGRGCWAGPLVAGAVCFTSSIPPGLKDSKLLNRIKRSEIDTKIRESTKLIGLGWVTADEIDLLGLSKSISLAMLRALEKMPSNIEIIIDGNINFLPEIANTKAIIKADLTISEVSAASIVAKVARDNYMIARAKELPSYHFDKHVGYGTKLHRTALEKHGVCVLHRKSFKPVKSYSV